MSVLMIDNYDSFTYNLVHYFRTLGHSVETYRHDQISVKRIAALHPKHIVISPGPCTPRESGVSCDVIRTFAGQIPILGVCLGMQCIAEVFGGEVIRAPNAVHGKTALVHHDGEGLFKDLPTPFTATRYHSLVVHEPLPAELVRTAWLEEAGRELLMGLQHREHPVHGVQFHPEAVLTEQGYALLENFLLL